MVHHIVQTSLMIALAAGCYKTTSTTTEMAARPTGMFGENGAATLNYVKGLGFTGAGGLISKFDCATCPGGKILLMIIPVRDAQDKNWQGDLASGAPGTVPGDVVAQVINIDTVAFPELSLDTNQVAYAWVGQIQPDGAPNNRGFGVYKLKEDGTVEASRWVTPKTGIKFCPSETHSAPHITPKHEGTGQCNPMTASAMTGKSRLGWFGASPAYGATARSVSTATVGSGGLWITCSGGCCQVSAT